MPLSEIMRNDYSDLLNDICKFSIKLEESYPHTRKRGQSSLVQGALQVLLPPQIQYIHRLKAKNPVDAENFHDTQHFSQFTTNHDFTYVDRRSNNAEPRISMSYRSSFLYPLPFLSEFLLSR